MKKFEEGVARGFAAHEKNGVVYLTVPAIDESGRFYHGFTTRLGGVSAEEFSTLNLSMTREANAGNKKENFRRAAAALELNPDSLILVNYEHGDGIADISAADAGKGFAVPTDLPKCDALVVSAPGAAAVTLHADCVPVFCVDRTGSRGGVCHAGWKGVAKRLPQKLAQHLIRAGSRTEDLIVGIGPHIRACCFEVGPEVAIVFEKEFGPDTVVRRQGEKGFVSLERAILHQLRDGGIEPAQITAADECTSCREDLFYSHRRDHGRTGAMGAFLSIR